MTARNSVNRKEATSTAKTSAKNEQKSISIVLFNVSGITSKSGVSVCISIFQGYDQAIFSRSICAIMYSLYVYIRGTTLEHRCRCLSHYPGCISLHQFAFPSPLHSLSHSRWLPLAIYIHILVLLLYFSSVNVFSCPVSHHRLIRFGYHANQIAPRCGVLSRPVVSSTLQSEWQSRVTPRP